MGKIHNFSAGPGILPEDVKKSAAAACINFDNMDLSLLEISHRSKNFEAVILEARNMVKELFGVGDDYEVLFLASGASLQFGMVPLNLLSKTGYAAYVNTGVWASKAIKQAEIVGKATVIASSEDKNFNYIPKGFKVPTDADYFHFTSNNTIYGTQFKTFPTSTIPIVCDMSSDIFSRKVDAKQFALIYAGAQKNMGPAGTTMVMIRKDMLNKNYRKNIAMLDYGLQVKGDSMYNTPPVFPIYVCLETMRWLKANGGIEAAEKRNNEKAEALYREIDRNTLFVGTAATEDRSYMNVCFLLNKPDLEPQFDAMWKEANIIGIRGHRDVGGYRASIYNAMPLSSVQVLIDVMIAFEKKYA